MSLCGAPSRLPFSRHSAAMAVAPLSRAMTVAAALVVLLACSPLALAQSKNCVPAGTSAPVPDAPSSLPPLVPAAARPCQRLTVCHQSVTPAAMPSRRGQKKKDGKNGSCCSISSGDQLFLLCCSAFLSMRLVSVVSQRASPLWSRWACWLG